MDPRDTVSRIYKEDHYTLLHTKYESSGPCSFGEEDSFVLSHCKSMGANDHQGGAISDPRGMIGRIYKEDHYALLHTKKESSGPCGFGEEDSFIFPIVSLWKLMTPEMGPFFGPRGMVYRIYEENHYTLLHTKTESSGPCFLCFPMMHGCRVYKEDHYTLLNTKYESYGPCGFGEFYFYVFPMTPPALGLYGPQWHTW